MTQQAKLTDENFYPEVVEEDGEEVVRFDPDQTVVCKMCGRPMKRMAPGATGNFEHVVGEDYIWSCRSAWCGTPHSEGGPRAGGSTLRAMVTPDGQIMEASASGEPEVVSSREFVDDPELGKVHSTFFDPEMYAEIVEDDEE